MKYLICICSGGLGNRLRPLSSCVKLAHETKRQLLVWWTKDHRCSVPFSSLWNNYLEFIDESFIDSLNSGKFYIHSYTAVNTIVQVTHNDHLQRLMQTLAHDSTAGMHISLPHDQEQYVVVIADDFLSYTSDEEFIISLDPDDRIKNIIDSFHLSEEIIGVHARGTDFNCPPEVYIDMMRPYKDSIFYLATDDKDMEHEIRKAYPWQVITLYEKKYATKKEPSKDYRCNTLITGDAMIYSVAELYILAKTSFLLGNERSSYFQIAKILHHANFN